MKNLLLILTISILLFSCGSRKKNLEIQKNETELNSESSGKTNIESDVKSSTFVDINKYMHDIGLKIISTGNDYKFRIGDFEFSGNADVEFSNKKEETKTKIIEKVHTTYKSETTYRTLTNYQTKTYFKTLEVKSEKPMFWLYVLVYLCGFATPIIIYLLIKKYKK